MCIACKFIWRINKRERTIGGHADMRTRGHADNGQDPEPRKQDMGDGGIEMEMGTTAAKCEMRVIMYVCEYYN